MSLSIRSGSCPRGPTLGLSVVLYFGPLGTNRATIQDAARALASAPNAHLAYPRRLCRRVSARNAEPPGTTTRSAAPSRNWPRSFTHPTQPRWPLFDPPPQARWTAAPGRQRDLGSSPCFWTQERSACTWPRTVTLRRRRCSFSWSSLEATWSWLCPSSRAVRVLRLALRATARPIGARHLHRAGYIAELSPRSSRGKPSVHHRRHSLGGCGAAIAQRRPDLLSARVGVSPLGAMARESSSPRHPLMDGSVPAQAIPECNGPGGPLRLVDVIAASPSVGKDVREVFVPGVWRRWRRRALRSMRVARPGALREMARS